MVYWKLPFMLTRKEVLRQVSGLDVWWTLRASIDYGRRPPIERLHGYRALTERLHSQTLDRLSVDAEPTDAEPWLSIRRCRVSIVRTAEDALNQARASVKS